MTEVLSAMELLPDDFNERGVLSQIDCRIGVFVDIAIGGTSNKKDRDTLLGKIDILSEKYSDICPVLLISRLSKNSRPWRF